MDIKEVDESSPEVYIVEALLALNPEDFLQVIMASLAGRETGSVDRWPTKSHFVLCDAATEVVCDSNLRALGWSDDWTVSSVARPDQAFYGSVGWRESELCQYGECGTCGTPVVSAAKNAICPVCGAGAHCT
jgi:hypothetical protein